MKIYGVEDFLEEKHCSRYKNDKKIYRSLSRSSSRSHSRSLFRSRSTFNSRSAKDTKIHIPMGIIQSTDQVLTLI
ncbi:hypothetical protein NPIL_665761 [Nephila pilipes]|uniref:Uncharacterized protein n=1 Tax=Nephila pilipes TaxID=299642 RepID=A0A8X6U6K4_NEPPI|nr:hypothetical protein NPIL_665761 [Nephila pilipes]